MSLNRQLSNGEYLVIEFNAIMDMVKYSAYVEDTRDLNLIDFEGHKGTLAKGQTKDELADELAAYCNSVIYVNEE